MNEPLSPPPPEPASAMTSSAPIAAVSSPMVVPATVPPTPRLVTVQGVNWSSVLDFTHLFRGFRLAINPAKLAIALLAIVLIYAAGRLFDAVWGPQVYRDELASFVAQSPADYATRRAQRLVSRRDTLDDLLRSETSLSASQREALKDDPRAAYRALRQAYREQFERELKTAADARAAIEKESTSAPARGNSGGGGGVIKTPAQLEREARQLAAGRLLNNMRRLQDTVGHGIFDTLLTFETNQFDRLVENTLTFVRITPVRAGAGAGGGGDAADAIEAQAVSGGLLSRDPERLWRSDTVAGCIANMTITAPHWLFTGTAPMQWRPENADTWAGWLKMLSYRAMYFVSLVALTVFSLLLLAITGASITRLSALELAGIERAPLKDVFLFAFRRLWVFIKAPIMPFLILLAIGLVMTVLATLGAIPYIGPIIIGAFFFVFLAVSFVLMLLLLGILGGFNLLYPTVAVEGSDAFDAMSRAFAYVYSRPWRLLFYTVVALVYGVFTFLFVSFAVYLILFLTHVFVGWGTNFFGARVGAYTGAPELDTLWPRPQFLHLVSPINWYAMSWAEFAGSLCLHFWVFLLITGIGAYVISYYFSSHTIIYLLLRRSVDGQHLREVFLEEPAK